MKFKTKLLMLLNTFTMSAVAMAEPEVVLQSSVEPIYVANFATDSLDNWEAKSFEGLTEYSIIEVAGKKLLQAKSDSSASGIAKELTIDLKKTPYLNWSWKVDTALGLMDETSKQGDDYAARLYVVKKGGWQIWKTIALNYVWSSNKNTGDTWDNAFAGENARMFALKDKSHMAQWQSEKRNVYQDMIELYGDKGSDAENEEAYRYIDAVAIMTDTDNGGGKAEAFYGDIYFTAD